MSLQGDCKRPPAGSTQNTLLATIRITAARCCGENRKPLQRPARTLPMRKRAPKGRGSSDHAYQTPSPLEEATQPALPLCKFCMHATAVVLPIAHLKDEVNVFCSSICAVAFALNQHVREKIQWCAKHRRWTEPFGQCRDCVDDLMQSLTCSKCGKPVVPSTEKEVPNG